MNERGDIRLFGKKFHVCVRSTYWIAMGSSWKNRTTYRDGKPVTCGHHHKSKAIAQVCADKMRVTRPGKCPTYRPSEMSGWRILGSAELEKIVQKNERKIKAFVTKISKQGGVQFKTLQRDQEKAESFGVTWSHVLYLASQKTIADRRARVKNGIGHLRPSPDVL